MSKSVLWIIPGILMGWFATSFWYTNYEPRLHLGGKSETGPQIEWIDGDNRYPVEYRDTPELGFKTWQIYTEFGWESFYIYPDPYDSY